MNNVKKVVLKQSRKKKMDGVPVPLPEDIVLPFSFLSWVFLNFEPAQLFLVVVFLAFVPRYDIVFQTYLAIYL